MYYMNNTFPFQSANIITPKPIIKNSFYLDTFDRDDRLLTAIKRQTNVDKNIYTPVVNTITSFNNPVNSNDLIKSKNYKSFTKDELKETYIHDIYNMMTEKVSNVIKKDELDRIQGVFMEKLNNLSLYKPVYNPVYSSIDLSTNNYIFNETESKYTPYE